MRIIKFLALILVCLAILSVGVFYLPEKIQEYRIKNTVRGGNIVIDYEHHHWAVNPLKSPLSIFMIIRNKSSQHVNGNLVFLITLNPKGLEEQYIKYRVHFLEETYGSIDPKEIEEILTREGIQNNPYSKAILAYKKRGKKLPLGLNYEPFMGGNTEPYTFKFRKQISMPPGEIIKLNHTQDILPAGKSGTVFKIEIDSIELNKYEP